MCKMFDFEAWQSLSQHVSSLLVCWTIFKFDGTCDNYIAYKVVPNVDMLCPSMVLPSSCKCNGRFVIRMQVSQFVDIGVWEKNSPNKHCNQMASFAACIAAMYSASVVDNVTGSCFLVDQDTAPPSTMKT